MFIAADDSIPFWTALLLGGAMIVAGIAIAVITNGVIAGKIGPNPGAGIRTPATRSSPEAWVEAHTTAKPWMQFASMIAIVTGVAVIALSSSSTALLSVLFVGVALMVVVIIIGSVAADRRAKQIRDGQS